MLMFTVFLILVKYERIKFLVIALKSSVEVYAWAPKPYHKFMAFKVSVNIYKSGLHAATKTFQCKLQVLNGQRIDQTGANVHHKLGGKLCYHMYLN